MLKALPVLFEPPPPSVLDARGHDRLLEKLIAVYGEARRDIAPEITAAMRATARCVEAAAERVPGVAIRGNQSRQE